MTLGFPRDDSCDRLGRLIFRGLAIRKPRKRNREVHGHKTLRQSLYITGRGQPYGMSSGWDEVSSPPKALPLPMWSFYHAG